MNKIVKTAAVAICIFFAFTAEGCPQDGKASKAAADGKVFTADGEYTITKARKSLKLRAVNPKSTCKWYIFANDPSNSKRAIVIAQGTEKNTRVNLNATKSGKGKTTGKTYKLSGDSFYTESCGTWVKR